MYDVRVSQEAPEGQDSRSRVLRTYCLLAAFVFLRAFGNLCLAWGTKHFSQSLSTNPWTYLEVLLNPYVTLGIAMMIVALLVRLALLGVADISFVLPMTAIGYVLAALFGSVFLHEDVSSKRWLGTVLIFVGAALVGSTSQNTTCSKYDVSKDNFRKAGLIDMTWLLLAMVVTATVLSDLLQSYEMKRTGDELVTERSRENTGDDRQTALPDSFDPVPGGFVLRLHGTGATHHVLEFLRSRPRRQAL